MFDINENYTENVIAANTNGTLQAQVLEPPTLAPPPPTEEPEAVKTKTIKRKVIQKPVPVATIEQVTAPIVALEECEPRKIIKKKVKTTA